VYPSSKQGDEVTGNPSYGGPRSLVERDLNARLGPVPTADELRQVRAEHIDELESGQKDNDVVLGGGGPTHVHHASPGPGPAR